MTDIIEVKDLKKTFGRLEAVKGISLSVEEGATFGFLGPNGAGKSTTIKMLTTLLRPTSGRILIDGNHPHDTPGCGSALVRRAQRYTALAGGLGIVPSGTCRMGRRKASCRAAISFARRLSP
jgi:ABC-type multidrug transport system ATPase subunit